MERIIKVKPLYDLEQMWKMVRLMARNTVGKDDIDKPTSKEFKNSIIISKHSPIRELKFFIQLENIPVSITQQFSRHRIAIESSTDFEYMEENIIPTDIEHYVQTQRPDRTGKDRDPNALVKYSFTTNLQGLIDMSKKRCCQLAYKEAREIWNEIISQIISYDEVFSRVLVSECVWYNFCAQSSTCEYIHTKKYEKQRKNLTGQPN